MKLFLDVASKYLLDKDDFYRRKANITLSVSIIIWLLTILSGYLVWYFKSVHIFFMIPVLLFVAILTLCIAKSLYTKSFIYNEIYQDLEQIRVLANKESKKQEQQNKGSGWFTSN